VVRPGPHRVDFELGGGGAARVWLGAGRGWALLAPDHWVAPGSRIWLDALWMGIVFCPLGVWLPRPLRAVPLVGLALAGLGLAAAQLGLAPAGAAEYGGALAGVALAAAFARGVRRSSPLSARAAR
jgi:hypothetical protein